MTLDDRIQLVFLLTIELDSVFVKRQVFVPQWVMRKSELFLLSIHVPCNPYSDCASVRRTKFTLVLAYDKSHHGKQTVRRHHAKTAVWFGNSGGGSKINGFVLG